MALYFVDYFVRKATTTKLTNRQDHEENEFEVHEVYALDNFASTGDGNARETGTRTTVFKRNPDIVYQLKMKASRGI